MLCGLLNRMLDQWSVSQLRTLVKWYNRDNLDKAMPNKKAELLNRYHEICHHCDQTAPTLPSAPVPAEPSRLKELPTLHDDDSDPPLLDTFPSQANEDADDVNEEITA